MMIKFGVVIGLLLLIVIIIWVRNIKHSDIDKHVVEFINIHEYLGKWYEIARFENRFEKDLVGVTATYSLNSDNSIKVLNVGYKERLSGERKEAIGKAVIPYQDELGKLKVTFFWPFSADYYILELDKKYEWAAVGSSSDKYLWILSRMPQIDDNLYQEIIERLEIRGYDTEKLIRVEQKK